MDLVTLLTVCAVGAGIPGASLCPTRAPVVGPVILVEAARQSTAQSPTASSIGDQPVPPPAIGRWEPFIAEASSRFGVPELWIRAVMAAESAGETILDGRPITSAAGAIGLMQVMPGTYAELRLRLGLGADPYDPRDNILAGTAYLRAMYDRYGYPALFAAYNAGPARFDDHLRGGPLPDETQRYLLSIGPDVREAVLAEHPDIAAEVPPNTPRTITSPSGNDLFFPLGTAFATTTRGSMRATNGDLSERDFAHRNPASGGLFVPLKGPSGTNMGAGAGP
jgi:hypothetical protein